MWIVQLEILREEKIDQQLHVVNTGIGEHGKLIRHDREESLIFPVQKVEDQVQLRLNLVIIDVLVPDAA